MILRDQAERVFHTSANRKEKSGALKIKGRISVFERVTPGGSNFKNLRKPSVFYSSPSILVDGEGRGGVALSFGDVRRFVDRDACLRVPLSIILSPRFSGGARKPGAVGWFGSFENGWWKG